MEVRRKTKDNTIYILYALIQCRPPGHPRSIVRLLAGHHLRIPLGLQILFLLILRLLPLRPVHGFLWQILFLDPGSQKILHIFLPFIQLCLERSAEIQGCPCGP